MEKNHRKNQRFGESSGVSEKFDAYITKTIRHKFQDLYFKDRTEARRYLAMALDAMDRFPSKPHRHLLELSKVCIGKTAIYLEGDDLANEYIAEATNALTKVELDKAACDDLSNTIDEAMVILGPVQTRAEAKARSTEVVGLVNKTSEKYGMTVTINGKGGVIGGAEVTIKGDKISDNDGPVNQTGFNMTATYTVAAILVAALLAGIIVVRKNKLAKQ